MSAISPVSLGEARPFLPPGVPADEQINEAFDLIGQTRLAAYDHVGQGPNRPYFGHDSTLRMIHKNPIAVLGGNIYSYVVGMSDPDTAGVTIQFMREKGLVVGRNGSTAKHFETVILDPQSEADKVIDGVAVGHARVHNWAKHQARGPHPERAAGDPFMAKNGTWTIDVLGDGWKKMFETVVRPLTEDEDEIYRGTDLPRLGGFFGARSSADPAVAVRGRIERGELSLTEPAKEVARRNWHELTVPGYLEGPKGWMVDVVLELIGEEMREMYGLASDGPAEEEARLKQFRRSRLKLKAANRALKLAMKDGTRWLIDSAVGEEEKLNGKGLIPEVPYPYAVAA